MSMCEADMSKRELILINGIQILEKKSIQITLLLLY